MNTSSRAFEKALKFVLQWEGGYANHPADKGGETNKGITWTTYHAYRKSKKLPIRSVRLIEYNEVADIYYSMYWLASGCNLLPEFLALCHFDWAVNHGVKGAIKTLQQLVGTAADGVIGSNTKSALANALKNQGEKALCASYCLARENSYRRWGVGDQRVFLQGWLNRLAAVRAIVS